MSSSKRTVLRRLARLLRYGTVFIAGAITWEAIRLVSMNHADKDELVDQMMDAQERAHPIDYPRLRIVNGPTPRDVLRDRAAAEFTRCAGGRGPKPASSEWFAPLWDMEEILALSDERKKQEQRSEMASLNGVFTLRRVAICRSWGGCGPDLPSSVARPSRSTLDWEAQTDRESFVPSTLANAEPFVLSLACGMGLREKQGLPSYPNEARLVARERAWEAGRARRCATGKQTTCP